MTLRPRYDRWIILVGIIMMIFVWPSTTSVMGTVNGEPIYFEDFELRYRYKSKPLSQGQFFEQLALEKAVLQQIGETVVVTDQEVDDAVKYIMTQKSLHGDELIEKLAIDGMTLDDLRELYYYEILIDKTEENINSYLNTTVYNNASDYDIPLLRATFINEILNKTEIILYGQFSPDGFIFLT